jgi:hypothetical protein
VSLYLSGTKIQGHNLKVSATLQLAGEDMSGQGSHTPQAEKGDKAQSFTVGLQIPYKNADWLRDVVRLAQGKTSKGERTIYDIANLTANTMGVTRVVFQGSLDVREDDGLKLWQVSFQLKQYRSVPEKQAERVKAKTVAAQTPAASPVPAATPTETAPGGAGVEAPKTWLEDLLQKAEDSL